MLKINYQSEIDNGIHLKCNRADSDRGTLYHYWGYVGRWLDLYSEIDFESEDRTNIFRVISNSDRRLLFGIHGSLWR